MELIEEIRLHAQDHSLASLIPEAHATLKRALAGETVSAAKAQVALSVLKAAATVQSEIEGTSSLEKRLEELDAARQDGQPD